MDNKLNKEQIARLEDEIDEEEGLASLKGTEGTMSLEEYLKLTLQAYGESGKAITR
jgi:hypothetical protein